MVKHTLVKHTRLLFADEFLSVFDHFVWLALNGLIKKDPSKYVLICRTPILTFTGSYVKVFCEGGVLQI